MKKLLNQTFLLIICLLTPCLQAQSLFTNFKKYTTEDGLVSNQALCLLQDTKGYLWIGTGEGASRFDGKSFTNYGWDDNSLPSKNIWQIFQFNDSLLLFGTNSGIAVFNTNINRFENYRITDKELQAGNNSIVKSFAHLPNKRVVLICSSSLVILDKNLKVISRKKYTGDKGLVPSFNSDPLYTAADSTRIILHGGINSQGVNEFNTVDLTLSPKPHNIFSKPFTYDRNGYFAIKNISNTEGLFCIFGTGFSYINPETNDSTNFYFNKAGGESNSVRGGVLSDPFQDSILWLGSGSGLIRFNHTTKTYQRFLFTPEGKEYNSNFIHDMIFDNLGNLWAATFNGLVKIGRLARSFHEYDYDHTSLTPPYDFGNVFCDSKHRLWSITFGLGVFEWDAQGNYVNRYVRPELDGWRLLHEIKEIDGTLYIASGRGVDQYNEQTKQFEAASFYPDSLRKFSSLFLFPDSHQQLWIGINQSKGILKVDLKNHTSVLYSKKDSLHNPYYLPITTAGTMAEDKNGNIWLGLGHESGKLIFWERKTGKFTRKTITVNGKELNAEAINNLLVDDQNNLWLSTWYYGVLSYSIAANEWKQYDQSKGLPGYFISSIVFDADGNLWANNANGLSVLLKNQSHFRGFTRSEGFPYTDVSFTDFPFKADKNKMVLGCNDQLIWVDRRELLRSPVSCKIYLEKLNVENKQYSIYDKSEFTYQQSHFNFHFEGVNLMNGEENLYAYMLEGVDKDWIYCGTQKDANYANINPGHYKFKAKVSIANDKWSTPVEYSFSISPPYWSTWWFRTFSILCIASLIYWIYRIRIKRIIELENVRSRISRDLHDDIGSTLSSINLLSHSAKKRLDEKDVNRTYVSLEKINERTQRMLDNMNDIIWSIKPENDSLVSVLSRMREFAGTVLEAKNITCIIDFPSANTNLVLPLELKNNLFLIFKEAINNLAKYSGATQAHIVLSISGNKLYMRISDNGKGFDSTDSITGTGGNGMKNMSKRARESKAELIVNSKKGEGTTIEFIKNIP